MYIFTHNWTRRTSPLCGETLGDSQWQPPRNQPCVVWRQKLQQKHDSVLEKFDHEKIVVTLDSFSEKVSSISTMFSSCSSLGVHVIYHFLKFMTVGVTHGISKEIAHFTCQFVHETQIDIEIKQYLYCDIRESRVHFECEWLPQPCKLARQTHFADRRRIFKSICLSDSLTCVIYSLSYTLTVVSGVQSH